MTSLAKLDKTCFLSLIDELDYAFQPIINIYDGTCYGVEALLRNVEKIGFSSIKHFFQYAFENEILFETEIKLREKAIKKFLKIPFYKDIKLFFNIDNRVLLSKNYKSGETYKIILDLQMPLDLLCIEISEQHNVEYIEHLKEVVSRYKEQLYRIALDDFGAGYSGLQLLYTVEPEYIKVDRFFINNIESTHKKKLFLARIVSLAHTLGISVIAEGIETEKEFLTCREIGCNLAQGYFIQKPSAKIEEIQPQYHHIKEISKRDRRRKLDDSVYLSKYMEEIPAIKINKEEGKHSLISLFEVFDRFKVEKDREFFPVVNEINEPLGLIREKELKEYIYSPYGRDLLANSSIKKSILDFIVRCPIAEINLSLEKILEIFMMDKLGEGIMLTSNGKYLGFLLSNSLLRILHEKNLSKAMDLNPLTRLPGNNLINDYLMRACDETEKEFILIYFDFDNFKAFNDKYGFRQGDRAILLFAEMLSKAQYGSGFFVGHIGGDDFFLGIENGNISLCNATVFVRSLAEKFRKNVEMLYDEKDRLRGYIVTKDRENNVKRFPLMTVSWCLVYLPKGRETYPMEKLSLIIASKKKESKLSGEGIVYTLPYALELQGKIANGGACY